MSEIPNAVIKDVFKYDAWIAGASTSKIEYSDKKVKWKDFSSRAELQKRPFETWSCVTFSALDCLETIGNYRTVNKLFSEEQVKWLKDKGYTDDDGYLNFSDRFISIMSGTSRNGNSLDTVAETIRSKGLIPEKMLPWGGDTVDEYWDKNVITQAMLDLGKEFLTRFTIQHDWILTWGTGQDVDKTLAYYVKSAPLQNCSPVCAGWNGNVQVKSCPSIECQHATGTYAISTYIECHDQYEPVWKELALDYPILYAKRYDIIENPDYISYDKLHILHPELDKSVTVEQYTFRQKLYNYFKKLFGY